jgi:3-dehydroquinate synthetase
MHYNDATTSAKKAFSLVQNNKILSKNILGCFYIPELVFNISETFLTLSTANAHATIGESCKTMNMLGRCDSKTGAQDYFNITGAVEFSSDYTKIVLEVGGFDAFVEFIEDDETRKLKAEILDTGRQIRSAKGKEGGAKKTLEAKRAKLLEAFRGRYYALGEEKTNSVKSFLGTVNKEIVSAKAMFLAYSDPFEKYRALLFEYAHTLGHGVEAFANLCYQKALDKGVTVPESAQRLHGQCVGMAVLMAGQMSNDLGELRGDGFALHQGLVYLFNRHGGFDFAPLRKLFDALKISKSEFCEGVLDVVRRDNKRGYIACDDCTKSVDQLVTGRIGKMMRSTDKNAELRYLVEVDEDWQKRVLGMAYDGKFDKVADIDDEGKLRFRERELILKGDKVLVSSSGDVGVFLHEAIASVYGMEK